MVPGLHKVSTPLLVAALLLVGGSSIASAQQRPPSFEEAVDVRIVNIDVYVTDKAGRPVSDLDRSDFLLFVDGRPVEISNFGRLSRSDSQPRESQPGGEAPTADSASDLPTGSPEPLTVVLYVDNSALTPPHRNRVMGDLEEFVDREAGHGTRFLVAAYNLGLELLTPITEDAAVVREALERLREMPASGLSAISERRTAMTHIPELYRQCEETGQNPCIDCWGQMIGVVDTYAQSAGHRVGNSQAGLLGLARSLGGLPGRKSLVYLSDGLEQRPGIDLYGYLGEICPGREREMFGYMTRWDETSTLRELTAYANTHRVTLYALETTGLTNYSIASVEFDERRFTPSPRNDTLRASNLQNSLFILADETGGRAFFNANRPGPELERLSQDLGEYYSLGFAPPFGWDGQTHAVRVTLAGSSKGRTVRFRRRYRAVPEDERMAERTLAALVMGWEDNPLGTEIRIGEGRPLEDKVWEVPVEIVLPPEAFSSLPGPSGERQLVRVLMMAEDEKSRRTPMREKLIQLEGPSGESEDNEEEARSVVVNVEIGPGVHTIVIGVRDELSRIASYHRTTVEIEAPRRRGSSDS